MNMPGWMVALLTFPGVVMHELAHKRFCDLFNIPVYKVRYFRFGNPAGYVVHAEPIKYSAIFWISVGPLVINSIIGISFAYFAAIGTWWTPKWFLFIWIAFCAGLYAFPSNHDVGNIADKSKSLARGGNPLYLLSFPFVWLIYLANALRRWGFDIIYSSALIYLGYVLG